MDRKDGQHWTSEYSDKAPMSPENLILPPEYHSLLSSENFRLGIPTFGWDELFSEIPREEDIIKLRIASHPSYPRLLQAYIDCKKVGAQPEIACLLDEIQRDCKRDCGTTCLGSDPELDKFMETYCEVLVKYKSDLERPFDEATSFLNKVEMQLRNLCTGASIKSFSDEGAPSSHEEVRGGELGGHEAQRSGEDRDLIAQLRRRFGSNIASLNHEFSKKKKNGRLPNEARQALLQWWNDHNKWPYPTEGDKQALAELTGLDQKQIDNWFINRRKRHWKPWESKNFSVMDNLYGQIYTDD